MYVCASTVCNAFGGQRRMSDALGLELEKEGCEPPCRCCELKAGPLEDRPVLLTANPFLHLYKYVFNKLYYSVSFIVLYSVLLLGLFRTLQIMHYKLVFNFVTNLSIVCSVVNRSKMN